MQSASYRFWTRVTVSISYNDNHCTTGTSNYIFAIQSFYHYTAGTLHPNDVISYSDLYVYFYLLGKNILCISVFSIAKLIVEQPPTKLLRLFIACVILYIRISKRNVKEMLKN